MEVAISYQTLQLPPPYSHAFKIVLDTSSHYLIYAQEYLDRDSLSEQEITEEGFSLNDNWSWEGSVAEVWTDRVARLVKDEKFMNTKNKEVTDWIHISTSNGQGHPSNPAPWLLIIQELAQVALESSGKEQPLDWEITNESQRWHIGMSFTKMQLLINGQNVEWSIYKTFFDCIYADEFVSPDEGRLVLTMHPKEQYGIQDVEGQLQDFLQPYILKSSKNS